MAFEIHFEGLIAFVENPTKPSVRALLLGVPQNVRDGEAPHEQQEEVQAQRELTHHQPSVHQPSVLTLHEVSQRLIPQHRAHLLIDVASGVTIEPQSVATDPEFNLAGHDIEVRCCEDAAFRCDMTSVVHMRELNRGAGLGSLDTKCYLAQTPAGRIAASVTLACGSVKAIPGDAGHGGGWSIQRISPDFGDISDLSESVVCSIDADRLQIHKWNGQGLLFELTSTPNQTGVLYIRNTEVAPTARSSVDHHFSLYYDLAQPPGNALTKSGVLRTLPTFRPPTIEFVINGVTFRGNPAGGRPICPMALFEPVNY